MIESLWMTKYIVRSLLNATRSVPKGLNRWWRFWQSYRNYQRLTSHTLSARYLFPCLGDDEVQTAIEPTYFYQDSWAFEKIVQARPQLHVDVASHHKFVALLSKVVTVVMIDIRPLSLPLDTLKFQKGSILEMPFADQTLASVSSMCVVEHIGLGRYGDPLDLTGTEKAIAELKRVIQPGGNLYLSIPLDDTNRIYFNAHRAFTEAYLFSLFAPFEIVEKRYIFNDTFGPILKSGFGTGCYHLRCPAEATSSGQTDR